jgi:methyl-accepting chemotaxis protein
MGLTTRKNYRLLIYGNTLLIVFLGAVLAGCVLFFWLLPANLGESYSIIMATAREIRKVLIWQVAVLYSIISLLIILGIAAIHLLYSHRIAGPVHRLGMVTAKIGQGNLLGNLSFRRKDSLTEMADLINDLVSRYRFRVNTVKAGLELIETQADTVSELMQQGEDGDDLKQAVEAIAINVNNIERCLSEMTT